MQPGTKNIKFPLLNLQQIRLINIIKMYFNIKFKLGTLTQY